MKKLLAMILCALLVLSLSTSAIAEGSSLDMRLQAVRGNVAFTKESYPTIWITPVYDEHIMTQTNPEKYPARYLSFAAPENGCLLDMNYDSASFINHDTLVGYYYYAYDRASFELFLEKAAEASILKDGSDGTAIYIDEDRNAGRAMISIKDEFDGTAKLQIDVVDHSRDLSMTDIQALIESEVARFAAEKKVENLDGYWSTDKINSIQIADDNNPYGATIDTTGLTVTRVETNKVMIKTLNDKNVEETEITFDSYSYALSQDKEAPVEGELPDGTKFVKYNSEFTGYASITLTETGKYDRPCYLTIQIDCEASEFEAKLEAVYARIAMQTSEAE